jgi:hypothetical protein
MKWTGHLKYMREKRSAYRILLAKTEETRHTETNVKT